MTGAVALTCAEARLRVTEARASRPSSAPGLTGTLRKSFRHALEVGLRTRLPGESDESCDF